MASELSGRAQRRVHPKLRILANCDAPVLAKRAEIQACLSTPAASVTTAALATAVAPGDKGVQAPVADLDKAKRNVRVNVFIQSAQPKKPRGANRHFGRLSTVSMDLDDLNARATSAGVVFMDPAENLKRPHPLKLETSDVPPGSREKRPRAVNAEEARHLNGRRASRTKRGVLIGLIDVEGFDWTHQDFRDAQGDPRFVAIWDQGGTGDPPKGFDYGKVISQQDMRQALADAPDVGVSPNDLEPQSDMVVGAHGTHVASIAAGGRGVCSEADIAAVLIALPAADLEDRRKSFYDSTRLLDAVDYLLRLADARRQPVSINISLGTNGRAHDGSSILDRWIDALIAEPGRSICVAAGNAGQERPEAPDDLGYMLGRIHTAGRIAAQGLEHELEWEVVGDRIKDASENELEFWYEAQDRIAISVRAPDGKWIGPVEPGEHLENLQLADKTMFSVYNELHHPSNGANYIAVYLTPYLGDPVVGVAAGTWLIRLHGRVIRDGRFHGWIERDDPADLGDGSHFWPSFFSERSNVDAHSVSSLACGQRIVSVANLDEVRGRVNITSSQGPTRDGRPKPDVAAGGTDILAANGFGEPDAPWIGMTGTSMASPYVAGVVGLMMAIEPKLTAAQINGILKATAQPLPGGTYDWANDGGFGVVQAEACVRAAATVMTKRDVNKRFEEKRSEEA